MPSRSWIRQLISRLVTARIRKPRRRRQSHDCPAETLEFRALLSVITVTTLSDSLTHVGTSLRDAVIQANSEADPAGDTIVFDSGLAGGTISLTQGEFLIQNSMTITGLGADRLSISGNHSSRIFNLIGSASVNVTITGLTLEDANDLSESGGGAIKNGVSLTLTNNVITHNSAQGLGGGGIANYGRLMSTNNAIKNNSANGGGNGGGIANFGTLTSVSDTIDSNSANNGALGGGLFNVSILTLMNDTVSNNSASYGGGILNENTLTTTNVTIANNSASSLQGGGGGVFNVSQWTSVSDTVTNNSATRGGGIYNDGAVWNVLNTVVAANPIGGDVENIDGGLIDAQHTLIGDVSSGLTNGSLGNIVSPTNQSIFVSHNGIPILAGNGGPTKTIALAIDSPAIGQAIALATLAAPVIANSTSTTFSVDSIMYLTPGEFLVIDNEIVRLDSIMDASTVIVSRGQFGTTPAAHITGASFSLATDQTGAIRTGNDLGARSSRHSLTVTTNADPDPTDATLLSEGTMTLRNAVSIANADASLIGNSLGDTIHFANSLAGQTIVLTQGELVISNSMTITGAGAGSLTIDGNHASRIFNLDGSSTAIVTLTGLTLQNGNDTTGNGGGAIINRENLTLTNVTITRNVTTANGGGIFNAGTLTSTNNTIADNSALGLGGGIYVSGMLTQTYDTVANNSATFGGGGVFEFSGTWITRNSIIASNLNGGNVGQSGGTIDSRNTLIDDSSSGLTNDVNNNRIGIQSKPIFVTGSNGLPFLGRNGGSTQTIALAAGSPALRAGAEINGIVTDERGIARFRIPDIGAYQTIPVSLTGFAGLETFVKGSDPIAIAPDLVVDAPESGNIARATVVFTNWLDNEDRLSFYNSYALEHTFSVDVSGNTATLTLTGNASAAAYQTTLRSLAYQDVNNPAAVTSLLRGVTITIDDGFSTSAAAGSIAVQNVNLAPFLSAIETSPLVYAANHPETPFSAISTTMLVNDYDSQNLTKAIVQITSGYQLSPGGNDLLSFVNQSGITGSFDRLTGTLTLTGVSYAGNYREALRSVQFSASGRAIRSGLRSLTITVFDNDSTQPAMSVPITTSVMVTTTNDPPTISGFSGSLSYLKGSTPLTVAPNLMIADADSLKIASATVAFTNWQWDEDRLSFSNSFGLQHTFVTNRYNKTATLTISGYDTVAHFQTTLRSVLFEDVRNNSPILSARQVRISVSDGVSNSNAAVGSIAVQNVNLPPVVSTNHAGVLVFSAMREPTKILANALVNDPDSQNLSSLTVQITSGYQNDAGGKDILWFANQNGIRGSFDVVTGTLVLTGRSYVGNYRSALRSIAFNSTGKAISSAARTFTITAFDDNSPTPAVSAAVTATLLVNS